MQRLDEYDGHRKSNEIRSFNRCILLVLGLSTFYTLATIMYAMSVGGPGASRIPEVEFFLMFPLGFLFSTVIIEPDIFSSAANGALAGVSSYLIVRVVAGYWSRSGTETEGPGTGTTPNGVELDDK